MVFVQQQDQKQPAAEDTIEAVVGHVLFNKDGFVIFETMNNLKVKGPAQSIANGMRVSISGKMVIDPKHGRQLAATSISPVAPSMNNLNSSSEEEELIAYLGSGIIAGVGSTLARRIVEKFGANTFDVISKQPEKLASVKGVSIEKAKKAKESWDRNRAAHDAFLFLKSHGLTIGKAGDIVDHYHISFEALKKMITENPYSICKVDGIGFKTADSFAKEIGMSGSHPDRIRHGIEYAFLDEIVGQEGSTGTTQANLLKVTCKLLELGSRDVNAVLNVMLDEDPRLKQVGEYIYLAKHYEMERQIAEDLARLLAADSPHITGIDEKIAKAEAEIGFKLSETQRKEVVAILQSNVAILTGFPGTGKTTILDVVLKVLSYGDDAKNYRVKTCAAPSGKAAKRMEQATNRPSSTVHRMLGVDEDGLFLHDRDAQMASNVVILDEWSMSDVSLMWSTVQAIKSGCKVLFVGDIDQLPSVGAGRVFADMIESGRIHVSRLTEIRRQGAGSLISVAAKEINQGRVPKTTGDDFCFEFVEETVDKTLAEAALNGILKVLCSKLKAGVPLDDIQVLTPMRGTECGTHRINEEIQKMTNAENLSKKDRCLTSGNQTFVLGDRVLWLKNDKEMGLYNGDFGKIIGVDTDLREIVVDFGDQVVTVPAPKFVRMELFYAGTIHKSQGSEFKHVIMPVVNSHYIMLKKNIVYTGLTRGRDHVNVVTDPQFRALYTAATTEDANKRITSLKDHIMKACHPLASEQRGEDVLVQDSLLDDVPL